VNDDPDRQDESARQERDRSRRRPPIVDVHTQVEAVERLADLAPGCVVADIEHTVTSGKQPPTQVADTLAVLAGRLADRGLAIVFVSNARLAGLDAEARGLRVMQRAHKPVTQLAMVRRLAAGPLVAVWGDQPLTDGVLAYRLDVPFVRQLHKGGSWYRRLGRAIGSGVTPLMFRRCRGVDGEALANWTEPHRP
jgi:hypothetical protein